MRPKPTKGPVKGQQIEMVDSEALAEVVSDPKAWAEAFLKMPLPGEPPFRANYIQQLILGSKRRFNIIRVHRRGGKTWGLAVLALYYALTVENCSILIACPHEAQVDLMFGAIWDFIRVNDWIGPFVRSHGRSPHHRIEFDNRSRIRGFTTGAQSRRKAQGIRGQTADVVIVDEAAYLAEEDWEVLKPIMKGDQYRPKPPRVFVASTPSYTRGTFYELCVNPSLASAWNRIHVPVTENPSLPDGYVEEARALCTNDLEWCREWLAEFPEIGEGVFPKSLVDKAVRNYSYAYYYDVAKSEPRDDSERPPTRTMGVDWDKFNQDGHGPNIVVLEWTANKTYRVIWREEIPPSGFCLSRAVQRVIELDNIFRPEWIYVDRGFGEFQVEQLQLFGKRNPLTQLDRKVVGIQFKQDVLMPMPVGGLVKKSFKQAMVQVLRGWFEDGKIELPRGDVELYKQLIEYRVEHKTETTIKFSEKNDHGIAALGLAAMAMFLQVNNPYAPKPATKVAVAKMPEPVPSRLLRSTPGRIPVGRTMLPDFDEPVTTFSRRVLGEVRPGPRSRF